MLPILMTSYQAAWQQGWGAAAWDSEGAWSQKSPQMTGWQEAGSGEGQTELDPVPTKVPFCPSPP